MLALQGCLFSKSRRDIEFRVDDESLRLLSTLPLDRTWLRLHPNMMLRASSKMCLLWSTSLLLPSVSSFSPPGAFVAPLHTDPRRISLNMRTTAAWTRRSTASLATMQMQSAAGSTLENAGIESGNMQQRQEVGPKKVVEDSRRQSFPQQEPRVLKTIGPFSRSLEDVQYLTGAFAWIARHTGLKAAGTALKDGVNPFALLMSAVWVPRVMSLVSSPSPITVEEGIEMVTKTADGKYELNRLKSSQGGSERLAYLLLEDLNNVREGVYPIPSELRLENQVSTDSISALVESTLFAAQSYMGNPISITNKRTPQLESLSAGLDLPQYYLHDFHSLPGGFLNPEHAKVYDDLSESVFVGGHRMGRRMMLRPLYEAMAARGPAYKGGKGMKLLDIGTGPGSFLIQAQEAFPSLEMLGIDLSPAMLDFAKANVPAHPSVRRAAAPAPRFERANMEAIPAEERAFDFVTHSNCFHEMPEKAIQQTVREVMRVLKPGGLFVHMDAVQHRDDPSVSTSSRVNFDGKFVEPYMRTWMDKVDLDQACAEAGLEVAAPPRPFFVSTLRVYRKPLA